MLTHIAGDQVQCQECGEWFVDVNTRTAHWSEVEEPDPNPCMPPWEMDLLGWRRAMCGCWLQPRVNTPTREDYEAGLDLILNDDYSPDDPDFL